MLCLGVHNYYVATWPIKVQGFSNQACSSLQHNAGSHIFGMSNTHDQSFLFGVTKVVLRRLGKAEKKVDRESIRWNDKVGG